MKVTLSKLAYEKREFDGRNWITIGALVLGMLFAGAMEAGAVSNYYTSTTSGQGFVGTYGSSPLSGLSGNARCVICHPNYPSSTARNGFGSDFAGNGHSFNATLNNMDSDGDLFSNLTEINAGTYPGNAASFPSASVAGPMTVTPVGGLTPSGTAGGPFAPSSQIYTVTNTGTASMNWTATNVASWVTLSAAGGTLAAGANTTVTASINSGANSLAASGTSYTDTVTFTNTSTNTGNTTRPVSLTVNAAEAPTISTVSLPAGAVNTAYSQTLAATGGTTLYSWSVSAGTLPAGLSLSAAGVLDGMPTAEGTSSFTVRVAGANSASSTKDFSVTINAAAPPPTVDLSSDSGGSCSVALRNGAGGSYIDGTLILAGLGMAAWGIRIRRRRG